jgi:hypothetical protein
MANGNGLTFARNTVYSILTADLCGRKEIMTRKEYWETCSQLNGSDEIVMSEYGDSDDSVEIVEGGAWVKVYIWVSEND